MITPRNFFISPKEELETLRTARAILDKCYHVLTGMEIAMLEHIVDELNECDPVLDLSIDQINWFHSLQIQFSVEIAQWKNQER